MAALMATNEKPGVSNVRTGYGTTTCESSAFIAATAAADEQNLHADLDIRLASSSSTFASLPTPLTSLSSNRNSGGYQNSYYSSKANLCARSSRYSRDSYVFLSCKMKVDTMPNSETRQIVQRVEYFLNVLNHVCIGFISIYMTWLCLRAGLQGTGLHAWLVTIGFVLLMSEAVMCHYTSNVLTFNYRRTTKTTIHWILQVIGGSFGIAGVIAKFIHKGFSLHSTHAKLGFAAFVLCFISLLSGLSALFSMRLKNTLNPLLNKTFHISLGLTTFILALVSQVYGYETGFFSRKVTDDFQLMMKCITLISLFLSCIGPLQALYHKIRNLIRHFE